MTIDDLASKLDALAAKMDQRFEKMDQRLDRMDQDIQVLRKETREGFIQVNQNIQDINRRVDRTSRTAI